jgi:hypothetical protein
MLKSFLSDKETLWLMLLMATSIVSLATIIRTVEQLALAGTAFAVGGFLVLLVNKWQRRKTPN